MWVARARPTRRRFSNPPATGRRPTCVATNGDSSWTARTARRSWSWRGSLPRRPGIAHRKLEDDRGAARGRPFDPDPPAVRHHDCPGDGQAQTAAGPPLSFIVTEEGLEDTFPFPRRDAGSLIRHADSDRSLPRGRREQDLSAGGSEPGRVLQQVGQDLV